MLKHKDCKICQRIREETQATDQQINDYHESKGSYELFDKRDRDAVIDIMLSLSP